MKFFWICIPFFLLVACSSREVVEKPSEMFWPLPPEKPRIKLVDVITTSLDAKTRYNKTMSLFFGSEDNVHFIKPFGVAAKGNRMYVTDVGAIYYFDFDNGKFSLIGTNELRGPTGIAVSTDRVFVCDVIRRRVYGYDPSGKPLIEFGGKQLETPAGIAVDEKRERVVVSDAKKNAIFLYSLDGTYQSSFGRQGLKDGEFNIPYGVAVDSDGRIYVVDSGNFRLQIFDESGTFLKSIGMVGTSPGRFARPKGVALDSDGHIYVLDAAFGNFQIFDFAGTTLLAVGTTGYDRGEFMLPSSIYIDENDGIYVVDQINKRVQIFQYLKDI